ncbi:hypothetical protein [Longimicrobium sp.]|uniref:hypothetical protein n=1 Tax=Longimicrobium sp. TaxID=2029185 RepID=UPI002CAC2C5A|nr:hypothetical protein [Longimicrobium sp.]HSU14091.1 hypothetical protein [Longimicrobium sp.]
MRAEFLGDSYDLVKRFWVQGLGTIAPLYSHPNFVPPGMRFAYTAATTIPVLEPENLPNTQFGLLLDPDTGITLSTNVKRSHASLALIVEIIGKYHPAYMICFDQSFHRKHELSRPEQMRKKQAYLHEHGVPSFYYKSHAPFLFAALGDEPLLDVKARLISLGIPAERLVSEMLLGRTA